MSGWSLAARGVRLVATEGASRIGRTLLSHNAPSIVSNVSQSLFDLASRPELVAVPSKKSVHGHKSNSHRQSVLEEPETNSTVVPQATCANDTTIVINNVEATNDKQSNRAEERKSKDWFEAKVGIPTNNFEEILSLEHSSFNTHEMTSMTNSKTVDSTTAKLSQDEPLHSETIPSIEKPMTDRNHYYNDNTFSPIQEASPPHDEFQHLPEGTAVPSTRIARAMGFANLGVRLAWGTATELLRRSLTVIKDSNTNTSNHDPIVFSNEANAHRISTSLRRMRGAAMKLGQMLSIQDESIAPPALTKALADLRKGAEAMPTEQLQQQLIDQWGHDWKSRVDLEERPFAAASIGQVHRGTLRSVGGATKKVAVKVQYPGVADSIDSDLANLSMILRATGVAPPGLFLENVIRVGRTELRQECDYQREVENHMRFQSLIRSDPVLVAERFDVPDIIEELCTERILVTEYVRGGTVDKVVHMDALERNRIGRAILRLTMLELFVWRFMQTDPNWGNFLYDVHTRTTYLIDFGAAREYSEEFVRGYLKIVIANANRDEAALMKESIRMGFLNGEENDQMIEAHKLSGFCLGEPFQSYEPYDFKSSRITSRISEHGSVFLKHRLTPPPEEVYTLHRKLAGAYNLCIKLGSVVSCRDLLDEMIQHFETKDSAEHLTSSS